MTKALVASNPFEKDVDGIGKTYDQTPYQSMPFPQSAPEQLQTIAHIFGLDAPDVGTARVLELGCSAGGNLIPIAVRHPGVQALGVDLSGVQIAYGQQVLRDGGIGNVELRQGSIEDIDESWGTFDYIICHGVYSWVPPQVRSAILRVCSQRLSDNGVAYISYNTYPGWKTREILRDAMRLRGQTRTAPEEQLSYGLGMLDFMQQHATAGSTLKVALDENMPGIRNAPPSYLLHEFLEQHNAPCYFKDFLAAAADYDLAYLAEANLAGMFIGNYAEKIAQPMLRECNTQVDLEQHLDFVTNRQFRQTLLVKAAQAEKVQYALQRERLQNLHYAGFFEKSPQSAGKKGEAVRQTTSWNGVKVQFSGDIPIALAKQLHSSYPATRTMPDLAAAIVAQTKLPVGAVTEKVAETLERLLISGWVRARCQPVLLPKAVKAHPKRVPGVHVWKVQDTLGQAQAQTAACTLWHEPVTLDSLQQQVWQHADGVRDMAALTQIVAEAAQAGNVGFSVQGELVKDAKQQQQLADQYTPLGVQNMCGFGVLA